MSLENQVNAFLGPSRRGGLFNFVRGHVLNLQHISVDRLLAASWINEINYVPDCVVALWEGPRLLLAKVKNANGQNWYILFYFLSLLK